MGEQGGEGGSSGSDLSDLLPLPPCYCTTFPHVEHREDKGVREAVVEVICPILLPCPLVAQLSLEIQTRRRDMPFSRPRSPHTPPYSPALG